MRSGVRWCGVLAAASLLLAAPAAGQGVRITGVSTARYAELATAAPDSVPIESTTGAGTLRLAPDGTVVRCTEGLAWCHFMGAGERLSTVPLIQDVRASAWGFGQGVRAFAHVRGRAAVGEADDLWPAADDPLDVLAAYVEVDRASYRVRLGRQWQTSSLGWYNFDGLAVAYRPLERLTVEAFGGWSLMRGTNEYHDDALDGVEPFFPSERAYILGALARVRPAPGMAGTLLYQREIRTDRAALYSERLAADGRVSFGRAAVSGALEADLASGWLNEARLRADVPLGRGFAAAAEVRRYRPFFELWTIWGAFSPVGYRELGVESFWRRTGSPLQLRVLTSRRSYEDTGAELTFAPLRTDGWRFVAAASLDLGPRWSTDGSYRYELGSGAGISEGQLSARRVLAEGSWIGLALVAFQRAYEFRVQQGTVYGVGVDAGHRFDARTRLSGSLTAYRHGGSTEEPSVDWSQLRGSVRFEWTVGPEPGMTRPPEERP